MKINLFNKEITLRDKYCSFFGNVGSDITEPYVNLYVRFKGCNATCLFCEYQEIANYFNFDKYKEVLKEIQNKNIELRKIAYTGGEPTLNYNRFKDVLSYTRNELPNNYISLNTNGINLVKMFNDNTVDDLDCIALSKHHYINERNDKILGFKSISNEEIFNFQSNYRNKELLQFSCNLIKDEIDTYDEVIKFLENANNLDIYNCGIVSLIPVNDYCKENYIDINIFDLNDNFYNSKQFEDVGHCMCKNYLYTPTNFKGEHVKIYLKNHYKNQDITNTLLFDGEHLRYGFGEDNIIY